MPQAIVAVGVAPQHAQRYSDDIEESMRQAFSRKNVRAIGSCGLTAAAGEAEVQAFSRQVKLAQELDAVLIVEARGAYDEAYEVLSGLGFPRKGVILRAFDGAPEQLGAWSAKGCYISFGAEAENDPVTYCKLARLVPADHVLVESGAPDASILALGGAKPRCDQVVFVADALQGVCPGPKLATNLLYAFEQ